MKPRLHLVRLTGVPIYQQLQWEEALLRTHTDEWLIVNQNVPPAVVMGISGQVDKLIHTDRLNNAPVIRRFSGGGTVYVDQNTLFLSWICNGTITPEALMRWSAALYTPVFDHPLFALRERDYVLGPHKFGGNAQYITRNRWCHHSTLLWDYDDQGMACLKMPERTPTYRQNRPHRDFCCRLRDHYPSRDYLLDRLRAHLNNHYQVHEASPDQLIQIAQTPHRTSTELVTTS